MKWLKRILLVLAIALTAVILFCAGGIYLYKRAPSWYTPAAMSDDQRAAAARSAEDKMVKTYNWAARTRAHPASQPQPTTLSLSADELTAFLQKWQALGGDAQWSQYTADPVVAIQDNHLIVSTTVRSFGTVVSLHLDPSLDPQRKVHLELTRGLGGRL